MNPEYDFLFKLLIVGNSGVGKSCLLMRFADNQFNDSYISTIGVDFKIKTIESCGKVIKLQIWDTAGQERFRTITSSYYRGAHGIIVAYDVTDRESFEHCEQWISEIKRFGTDNVSIMLVGCKADDEKKRMVKFSEGTEYAHKLENNGDDTEYQPVVQFIETSAKTSTGVDAAFIKLAEQIREKISMGPLKQSSHRDINILPIGKSREPIHKSCC